MTTPNLEQIAKQTAYGCCGLSVEQAQPVILTALRSVAPQPSQPIRQAVESVAPVGLTLTRQDVENIIAAVGGVAPQPVKTEEASTKPTDAQRAEWHPAAATRDVALSRLQTLGRRLRYRGDEYNADIAELELVPYLRTDREPCQDTVRLQHIHERKLSLSHIWTETNQSRWVCAGHEAGTPQAAIDSAASANDGRARG